jgi:hypothetical protein
MLNFLRSLFSIILLILPFTVLLAQSGKLMLHGRVVHEKKPLEDVTIELITSEADTVRSFKTPRNGSYKVIVPLGTVYSITFKKAGYLPKSVGVIGFSPNDKPIDGRYFFQLDIELYSEGEEQDETMIPPVAKLYIEDPEKGFTYDKQYLKWVQDEYKDLVE